MIHTGVIVSITIDPSAPWRDRMEVLCQSDTRTEVPYDSDFNIGDTVTIQITKKEAK